MHRTNTTNHLTRAGLNLIQQALSIYDGDLRLAVANRPFQQMFGLPQHLVTPGAAFEDTIRFLVENGEYGTVSNPDQFVSDRVEQARAFVPHYMERTRANGRMICVEGSPLPEGGWVTVYTDITSIKRQEALLRGRSEELSDQVITQNEQLAQTNRELAATNAQLEETKRQLTEMEARIRLTTEMMPAHIAHLGRDEIYTYTNRRLSTVLPGRPRDIVGLSFSEALGHETADRLRGNLERALNGEPSVIEFTDDSSAHRIRTAFTPDTDASGHVNGVYLLSTDVTEEAQARAALSQTHKRELAAHLTSGLAHDFANLLTIILGLQGRLDKFDLPPQAQELTQATKTAARRGGMLLDKIARISGPREMHPAPINMDDFFAAFAPLARAPLPPEITLEIISALDHTTLMLDAGSLQDSLLNIVLNARDAMAGKAGKITLKASAVRDTWLDLSVEDQGSGFSQSAIEEALNPFFTTKGDSGSGLGLSMVYDHAQLSGGTVRLANTGDGAKVTIRLPLRPASAEARPMLVMVVEDLPDLRAHIRDMLIDFGHQVIEAASAEDALALIDLPGLDWVLSDIRLGGEVTGVDLLDAISKAQPDTRLALMTSLPSDAPLRQEGAARWPVLSKPIDAVALTQLFHAEHAS